MSSSKAQQDEWSGKIGVILAVAGSAVGLGNFLRFPGLAAQYGGGAFMVAYGLMLVLVGVPVAWAEWSIGRRGGQMGAHCAPGVFWYLTKGSRLWKFLGVLAVLGPSSVAFYYMVVEAWCCGYFWKMLTCPEVFATAEGTAQTFFSFTGMYGDGSALLSDNGLLWIVSGVILLNLGIIYRGISRGIEMFSRWFMPLLLLISLVLLVRILCIGTPDPSYPDRSIEQGLGYMWNPGKVLVEVDPKYFRPAEVEQLLGDPTKARTLLGWNPTKTSFPELVRIMMQHDMRFVRKLKLKADIDDEINGKQ